tara:strand:- start:10532 stop:12496 length:1965 start_codon:yes stop_codon:yes gene_type:complete
MTNDHTKVLSEWLETDGLGGFTSGTVSGQRTRRYHALLLVAQKSPADRVVLVNGLDTWVQIRGGTHPISTQYYRGEVESPSGYRYLKSFTNDPWPTWRYQITDEITIVQELFVPDRVQGVAVRWSIDGPRDDVLVHVRPFLSGRDFHGTHHANPDFDSTTSRDEHSISWQPYTDRPRVYAQTNGAFDESFDWYNSFLYTAERDRGLDDMEDLASPGEFHWSLSNQDAYLLLSAGQSFADLCGGAANSAEDTYETVANKKRARRKQAGQESEIIRSYVVDRRKGKTIIAGYPWFGDWGRDTFIAMRGLCLTLPGWLDTAHAILMSWADTISEGMLPNRFPDHGATPEFNSVDASLWYIIAVHDYLESCNKMGNTIAAKDRQRLQVAIESILDGYSQGTRFGIRLDDDGLIAAGEPDVQLTWMDAKVGDWVVTPRIGKPVEVQALWLSALSIASSFSNCWSEQLELGKRSFVDRFWNDAGGYLFDVVDSNHQPGSVDDAFRPNQIFAVGGLPLVLLDDEKARRVVDAVEQRLLTPMGLRSLCPDHPDYQPRYEGGVLQRDGAYHQGTVWPWLIGSFVDAWLRVRNNSTAAKHEGRAKFLNSLETHIDQAGIGHISEICDGESPHTPRGCPFQAWSFGEYLRIKYSMLVVESNESRR